MLDRMRTRTRHIVSESSICESAAATCRVGLHESAYTVSHTMSLCGYRAQLAARAHVVTVLKRVVSHTKMEHDY